MDTILNRNFKVRGDISCLYQPGAVLSTLNIENIEVELWHKSPMQVTLLGKGITNSDGEFIIEFEIDSPVDYIVDGKISDVFLEAFYNGEKLVISESAGLLTGLVSYWKLDELSGTTASDATGNGHTGVLSGDTIPTWAAGKINNGLNINGGLDGSVVSYLNVPMSSDFDFGTGDFTYAFWMNSNNTSGDYCIIDTGFGSTDSFLLQYINSGAIIIWVSSSIIYNKALVISNSTWYHIVIRRISSELDICVNGTSLGAITFTDAISITADLALGSWTGGPESLDGLMDEIGVWKGHGLSDMLVTQLYNDGNGNQYPF